jgi:hydroxypyruvate isomerase
MDRKHFLKNSLLGGSALLTATDSLQGKPLNTQSASRRHTFNLKYAPHFGMFKNLAGENLIDQIKFMADAGFTAIEDNGLMQRPPKVQEEIGNELAKQGMEMGVFVLDKGGNGANSFTAGKEEYTEIFLKGCRRAVDVAKRVNATWTTVVPGNFDRWQPIGIQTAHVIETLRKGVEILEPHGIVMVLEALSDTPDLFLRTSDQTYAICKAVDSPSCKILFDMYHMQRNEGDLINNLDRCWDEIAYIQIGDNPGRNEPGTGEVDYHNVFKHIYNKGYKGVMGMEHGNSKKGKEGERMVINAYVQADDFT